HHEAQEGEKTQSKVLVARYETNKALYAVERVQARLYSLCKLASWLKEKDVGDLWDPSNLMLYPSFPKVAYSESDGGQWWQRAVVKTEPEERAIKRAKISMLRPKPANEIRKPNETVETTHMSDRVDSAMGDLPHELPMDTPSPQQLLETLVHQYLDALYLSKTSLAYFAKGPITRIRAAFTSPEEGAPPTYDLVAFLRSMLLSHKAGDKKYREKLPDLIKSFPPGSFSDDDQVDETSKPKKSKKKVKLSREGVYPQESDVVKKWWMSELPSPEVYGEETIDQRGKRRIGDIRIRETLAQMILMLEIIALEALSTYKPPPDQEPAAGEEAETKPKPRKKKLDDINLRLDLLLDKLCIWQSVDQDDIFDFDAKANKKGDGADGKGSGDRLQSFCVEVIIPFYMNRLPEQAMMINKKLGGPVHISPPKRKAMKPPTTSRKSGEPKEPDTKKSRRTLARVGTDTVSQAATRRTKAPSLTRSSTDPAALQRGIKREVSEVPLSAIPFSRSPSAAARQSMSQFKHLKGREIDLSTSAAAAAKLKHKKRVQEDLKEAITALKKPNRGLAAGPYADELLERKAASVSSKPKKTSNPARKIVKDVLVSATPRIDRRTKEIEQTPIHHHNPFFIKRTEHDTPASSSFCIPSSAVRPASTVVAGTVQRSVTGRTMAAPSIAETPSKAPTSKNPMLSPGAPNTDKAFGSPSAIKINSTPPAIFATPTKEHPAVAESPLPAAPVFSTPARSQPQEQSIYDALGWDDDDDLL
ncbi:DNA replication regulator SLD3-domain-containing protein, partial [Clohesyomyces aquaticus]